MQSLWEPGLPAMRPSALAPIRPCNIW